MDPLFSGSIARQRQINLGGTIGTPTTSSQLAAQARSSRLARDALRRQQLAALTVQAYWRGSKTRALVRTTRRNAILQAVQSGSLVSVKDEGAIVNALSATRHLALILGRNFAERASFSTTSSRDQDLLRAWSEAMVVRRDTWENSPTVFTTLLQHSPEEFKLWSRSIITQSVRFLTQRAPQTAIATQEAILRLFSLLLDFQVNFSILEHRPIASDLLRHHFYAALGSSISSCSTGSGSFIQLAAILQSLTLAPFDLLANESVLADAPQLHHEAVQGICVDVLGIASLPGHLPLASFARLAAKFPIDEVSAFFAKSSSDSDPSWRRGNTVSMLANFLALGSQRVPHLAQGQALSHYLEALVQLQTSVPEDTFSLPLENRRSQSAQSIDQETRKRLAILPSDKHVCAILAASSKYPSTTRPALHKFLCSVLYHWPQSVKLSVVSAVLYGSPDSAGQGAGQGNVRELWRGYVRSSPLSRKLVAISAGRADAAIWRDESPDWAPLILLCELYSRILLTLGDDEFFPSTSSTSGIGNVGSRGARGGSVVASSSPTARNPLSIDEVISLTALVRNLTFALYWHSAVSDVPMPHNASLSTANKVPGLGQSFLSVRDSMTRLLQQIHARDARTRFTPDDFWLMTDEMDIDSFVQSVMLEEDKLAGDSDESMHGKEASILAADEEEDDEDHDGETTLPHNTSASRRHVSSRKLAFISPRLGILNNLPFVIPFTTRIQIFRAFIFKDADRLRLDRSALGRRKTATVRRDHVAEDGMAQLNGLGRGLKERIEIIFKDQWGMQEAGIDGGGVFKEFLTSLIREAFDTDRGLWRATDQQELYPHPASYARQPEQLQWYAFLGRILGKALYEGILVDVRFASFFLSKWFGRHKGMSHLDDLASLASLDSELYRGLIYLKNYTGDVEADLSLNFTVTDEEFGQRKVTELVPDGANIAVTDQNRLSYIFRVANYRLDAQIRAQSKAFFMGLSELIDPRWLRIFDQVELQRLVKGSEEPINIDDLRANTVYSDYHEKDLTIEYFWQSLESFDQQTRAALLKFVTSCPSPPLLGFSQLNPKFCIRLSSEDSQRLPTSSTCVNLLKLPRYTSLEQCQEKLLTAIRSGAGFDLS